MNGFGPKLLVVCLSGVLSLPAGFCCRAAANHGHVQTVSTRCCRSPEHESPGKAAKPAKSCCCQEWINVAASEKPLKRTLVLSLPATPASSSQRLANAPGVVLHAFLGAGEHSFQSLYCVWRC